MALLLSEIGTSRDGLAVTLPEDAITQGFAILARRRSGKSQLAGVMQEVFCERGDPWVCLDPVSAHWGIRYRDQDERPGAPSGLDVLIVGGKQADVALNEHSGGVLAEIIVNTNISCIIDLGDTTLNARQKFVAEFANELYRINTTPRHVFLEEADEFVPQQLEFDNQKLVRGALERLIKGGGGRGIGFTLITQRPASISKKCLTQVDNLFAMRLVGPQDLRAAQDWFEHNVGDKERLREIVASLPSFQPGEAWLLSPDWLGDMTRLQVRRRWTYHAGRTPRRGEQPVEPKRVELKNVIAQFRTAAERHQFAITEERDLRQRVKELEREVAAKPKAAPVPPSEELIKKRVDAALQVERANVAQQQRLITGLVKHVEKQVTSFRGSFDGLQGGLARLAEAMNGKGHDDNEGAGVSRRHEERVVQAGRSTEAGGRSGSVPEHRNGAPAARRDHEQTGGGAQAPDRPVAADGLTGPEQRVLNAIAWWEAVGVASPPKVNVGIIAGWRVDKRLGGTFGSTLGSLKARDLIDYPGRGGVCMTEQGRLSAEVPDAAPTLTALHEAFYDKLDSSESRVLKILIECYPEQISKVDCGQRAGWQVDSRLGGTFGSSLGRLRAFGLIDYPSKGYVVATKLLFPEGL